MCSSLLLGSYHTRGKSRGAINLINYVHNHDTYFRIFMKLYYQTPVRLIKTIQVGKQVYILLNQNPNPNLFPYILTEVLIKTLKKELQAITIAGNTERGPLAMTSARCGPITLGVAIRNISSYDTSTKVQSTFNFNTQNIKKKIHWRDGREWYCTYRMMCCCLCVNLFVCSRFVSIIKT